MIELPAIINKAELSRQMGISKSSLSDKLNERQRNRLSSSDKEKIVQAVSKALEKVKEL